MKVVESYIDKLLNSLTSEPVSFLHMNLHNQILKFIDYNVEQSKHGHNSQSTQSLDS